MSIGSNHNDDSKTTSKSNSAKEEKTNIAENSNEMVLEQENCITTEKTESNETVSNEYIVKNSYTRNRENAESNIAWKRHKSVIFQFESMAHQ